LPNFSKAYLPQRREGKRKRNLTRRREKEETTTKGEEEIYVHEPALGRVAVLLRLEIRRKKGAPGGYAKREGQPGNGREVNLHSPDLSL